jgi:hypothetical protein
MTKINHLSPLCNGELRAQLNLYAECVFDPSDIVEQRNLPSKRSSWFDAAKLPERAELLTRVNEAGQNIYVGVNPRSQSGGRDSTSVALARNLVVDFDDATAEDAAERISSAGLPIPTLSVTSGHGAHYYWRLTEPVADLTTWSEWQRRLIFTVGSDPKVHDPPRIVRLPGLVNHKDPPALAKIIEADPARRYSLQNILPHLLLVQKRHAPQARHARHLHDMHVSTSSSSEPLSERIQNAIRRTQPTGHGQRNRKIFDLARELTGFAELADSDPITLRPWLQLWHQAALPNIRTKDFDVTWLDFLIAWRAVVVPIGMPTFDAALDRARAAKLPECAERYGDDRRLVLLVKLCCELQAQAGNHPFFLSYATAGDALGVSYQTAGQLLRLLRADGIIRRLTMGTSGRSSEYRYTPTE